MLLKCKTDSHGTKYYCRYDSENKTYLSLAIVQHTDGTKFWYNENEVLYRYDSYTWGNSE